MSAELIQADEAPAPATLQPAILPPMDGSNSEDDSHEDEDLALLPRHTKIVVIGNNRTKASLVGLSGTVKKAVGLGGWHWLVCSTAMRQQCTNQYLSALLRHRLRIARVLSDSVGRWVGCSDLGMAIQGLKYCCAACLTHLFDHLCCRCSARGRRCDCSAMRSASSSIQPVSSR